MSARRGLGAFPALANAKALREASSAVRRCWPDEDTGALRDELDRRAAELEEMAYDLLHPPLPRDALHVRRVRPGRLGAAARLHARQGMAGAHR